MNCKDSIHPFQYDSGTSQSQRVMSDLLDGPAQLDGRTIADMLGHFRKFARQINFYDVGNGSDKAEKLVIKDWQPFFRNSLPFALAAMVNFPQDKVKDRMAGYRQKFLRKPSRTGLDVLINYIYTRIVKPFSDWDRQVGGTGLPIETALNSVIKKECGTALKNFISTTNTAARWYRIDPVDFSMLLAANGGAANWGLTTADLGAVMTPADHKKLGANKRARQVALYSAILGVADPFLRAIHASSGTAGISLQQSFASMRDDLRQRHSPHLALIFAFLDLFRHLQDGLNGYTKKHLDFFYRQVLQLQPNGAVPDKAHIVFAVQKQLGQYRIEKGQQLKGPKDDKKADILFALDDEIVVNQAQVTDIRTLHVNNLEKLGKYFVEGVYMAPAAIKADGVDKDFKDGALNSWPTLGARKSKYADPRNKFIQPYPDARIGCVLASPVLLLNEGDRTITITLDCRLDPDKGDLPLLEEDVLFQDLVNILQGQPAGGDDRYSSDGLYYYINQDLVAQAVKAGIDPATEAALQRFLSIPVNKDTEPGSICYSDLRKPIYEVTLRSNDFVAAFGEAVRTILLPIFPPQQALQLSYSGDKQWIVPKGTPAITVTRTTVAAAAPSFRLTLLSRLGPDEDPVSFYNKAVLAEDLGITDPAVRIQLNSRIRFLVPTVKGDRDCCLRPPDAADAKVSLYHFFRNAVIVDAGIGVTVCGLKKFIVQNDESLQDVNKPVYPFGTRPEIVDFDAVNPRLREKNLVGPNFYIGSREIFFKKWDDIHVNLNWKNKPVSFNEYYKAYLRTDPPEQINVEAEHGGLEGAVPRDAGADQQPVFGLNEQGFEVNLALLENGAWGKELADGKTHPNDQTKDNNRFLFTLDDGKNPCNPNKTYVYSFYVENKDFAGNRSFSDLSANLTKYDADTRRGFLRFTLENQDFLHKDYAYVLARQMMAFSRPPGEQMENAVYYNGMKDPVLFSTDRIKKDLGHAKTIADDVAVKVHAIGKAAPGNADNSTIDPGHANSIKDNLTAGFPDPSAEGHPNLNLPEETDRVSELLNDDVNAISASLQAIIPNEPWTPIISGISLDYSATAAITDIKLVHLYPFAGTYKQEEITLQPTLFPAYWEEGSLFLGLSGLVPGTGLNVLFQLAEATSDTEADPEPLQWSYLDHNSWKPLRTGFEMTDDATHELSTSGIVKFALPDISASSTVMPAGLCWIRASIASNSGIVAETIGVYTQAVRATFTNDPANDTERLAEPLAAGTLTKLATADANVKKVDQPFAGFGGRIPESDGYFYVHASEKLRHKGRAIQPFDYERLALDACPQLFKAKCISHSFQLNAHQYSNDIPTAPGYVLLAVIPDMTQLKASGCEQPRVPLSLLEDLEGTLRKCSSPFARIRVANPRYEKVDFCVEVKLLPGKDKTYYQQQLQEDIRHFMAPWAVGEFDKLQFGQVINRSDVMRYLETRDYIDYVIEWRWRHDEDLLVTTPADQAEIFPMTPRSILIAGHIDVSILQEDCQQWDSDPVNNSQPIIKIFTNGQCQ